MLNPCLLNLENIMKSTLIRKIAAFALIGLVSQLSLAQDNPNGAAFREIAEIVASINHFPSDADKAKLMAISSNDAIAPPLRSMATTVSNISHAANAEGKAAMAEIQASEAPDNGKALAALDSMVSICVPPEGNPA